MGASHCRCLSRHPTCTERSGALIGAGRALASAALRVATAGDRARYAARAIHDLQESGQPAEAIALANEFQLVETGGTFLSTRAES